MEHLNEVITLHRAEIALMALQVFGLFALLIVTGWAYTHADWSEVHE